MMTFLTVSGGLIASVLLGRAAVRLITVPTSDRPLPPAEIWGLSIVLGIGLTGWLSFFWSWMNGPLGFAFSVSLAGAGTLLGLSACRQSVPSFSVDAGSRRLVSTCQWLIGLLILMSFVYSALTPQRFWDERAIFAIKAAVLWEDGSINSPTLLNPEFVQYHPRYPLMLPLIEQHLYSLLGGVQDRWSKLWCPLLYAGLILTWTGVCTRHFGHAWAWLWGLLLAAVPVLMPYEYGFISAQADAPMACFHGVAVLYLWDALCPTASAGHRSLVLAGFAASCAAFTKDEGIAFLMIDILSWTLAILLGRHSLSSLPQSPSAWQQLCSLNLLLFIALPAVLLTPWFAHRRLLPDTTEMRYFERTSMTMLFQRLDTLRWSLPHLFSRMFSEWQTWGLQWCAGVAAVITRPRRALERPQLFLISSLLGALAALLAAGMLAPAELEEHLGGSTHRYLMQLVPIVMLLTAAQWADRHEDRWIFRTDTDIVDTVRAPES